MHKSKFEAIFSSPKSGPAPIVLCASSCDYPASRISFKFCISVIRICFVFRASDFVLIFYPPSVLEFTPGAGFSVSLPGVFRLLFAGHYI